MYIVTIESNGKDLVHGKFSGPAAVAIDMAREWAEIYAARGAKVRRMRSMTRFLALRNGDAW